LTTVSRVPALIRDARRAAGLTQVTLARRLGTSQSAIARLERSGSNPTVGTVERVLGAAGRRLELSTAPPPSSIDETLVAGMLRMTPEERLQSFEGSYRSARAMALAGARARGELA
jgi:transcriptional regulator with XRE-family HTH domain